MQLHTPNTGENQVKGVLQKEQYDQSITDNLKKYGYAFVGVNQIDDEDPQPAYVYTVGLHTFGVPDLFLSGNMKQETAMKLINNVIDMWRRTGTARTGRINNFLAVGRDKMAIGLAPSDAAKAIESHMTELKKRFPDVEHRVVQLLWPDEKGFLPTNADYSTRPDFAQRHLVWLEQ